ncbi:hypothetical protein LJR175_008396 [Variovorax sp. LjRoot175]|uniref:hypothetical protein n=1 Tax=Variovorax sp. LjRoot175 TaxID=3342276 RepID=UPI003ECC8E42
MTASTPATISIRLADALTRTDAKNRAVAAAWIREDARSARDSDSDAGLRPNLALAELLDEIANNLDGYPCLAEGEVLRLVERTALDASVAELEALNARATAEPLYPSEGESLALVLHELKRLRSPFPVVAKVVNKLGARTLQWTHAAEGLPDGTCLYAGPASSTVLAEELAPAESGVLSHNPQAPDPAVVTQEDLEALLYVEDMVRSSGFGDKADRLTHLHDVLLRVAQGREASHYKESLDRAVQRLVLMRELIPAEALRTFEVEWRTRKREPLADADALNLPETVRSELRAMAGHCGAVAYSPVPLRAVRGVSLTFEQLEAFALLVSGAVWPVPTEAPR